MHILQLCPRVPYPPHDGGAIAMYGVTAGLARAGHRVTVLAANTPKHHQPADALAHLGPNVRLVAVDVDTDLSPWQALRNLLFSGLPYNVERFVSPALAGALAQLLEAEAFDAVQAEGTFVAWYVEAFGRRAGPGRGGPPWVLRAHNVEHTIWQMLAARSGNPFKRWYLRRLAARLERFERRYLPQFDAVAAITKEDAGRLRALGCAEPVVCIPAGVDLVPVPSGPPKPRTLFLIGSLNWRPNREGLEWLLREVWPAVHAELPDLELHVAGTGTPLHLRAPRADNVFVHGFVDSAAAFMRQYDLMLVPLLSGGGMRVKIIEGLALGKAILSTGLGAEGIAVRDGHDVVLRDGAAAWQAALRDYYRGRLPLGALGAAAARTAAAVYGNDRVTERFAALYARLGAGAGAAG